MDNKENSMEFMDLFSDTESDTSTEEKEKSLDALEAALTAGTSDEVVPMPEQKEEPAAIPVEEENLTAMERLRRQRAKEAPKQTGLVVDKKAEDKHIYSNVNQQTLVEGSNSAIEEMDDLIRKASFARKNGLLTKGIDSNNPADMMNAASTIELIDELSSVTITEDQKLEKKETAPEKGDKILSTKGVKTDTEDTIKHLKLDENGIQIGKPVETPTEEKKEVSNPEEEEKKEAEKKKREELVTIIIDKMKESSIEFTDEEREKMTRSKVIQVKVVDTMDMAAIEIDRSPSSFSEMVSNDYNTEGIQTPVVFPSSGFRAYMTGLGVGEMMDLSLNNKTAYTIDDVRKRLMIIYRHMVNPTIVIENFNDFLDKFAYDDIEIAVWGAFVSTFPPEDTITLTCGKEACKKPYDITYRPDQILDWDSASTEFLEQFKEIATCTAPNTEEIAANKAIRKSKTIKMPYSNIIVEVGKPSSKDWLDRVGPVMMTEDSIKEIVGDNPSERDTQVFFITAYIRNLYFPKTNGKYASFNKYKDIYDALAYLKVGEVEILTKLVEQYNSLVPTFALPESVCPACGNKSGKIEVNASFILFRRAQDLSLTEFEVSGI